MSEPGWIRRFRALIVQRPREPFSLDQALLWLRGWLAIEKSDRAKGKRPSGKLSLDGGRALFKYGWPTFILSKDAATLLELTDMPSIEAASEVRLPYPACIFVIPTSDDVLTLVAENFGDSLIMVTPARRGGVDETWNRTDGFQLSLFANYRARTSMGLNLVADPDEDLSEDQAKELFDRTADLRGDSVNSHKPFGPPSGIASWAIKCAALISARPNDVEAVNPHRKHGRCETGKSDLPWSEVKRWIVGRTITMPSKSSGHNTSDRTYRITTRFMVRGHWRLQAYGNSRSERKIIWIMPFWKGPRNAEEALTRTYEIHQSA